MSNKVSKIKFAFNNGSFYYFYFESRLTLKRDEYFTYKTKLSQILLIALDFFEAKEFF